MCDLKKKFENIDMVQSFGNSFDIPDRGAEHQVTVLSFFCVIY